MGIIYGKIAIFMRISWILWDFVGFQDEFHAQPSTNYGPSGP